MRYVFLFLLVAGYIPAVATAATVTLVPQVLPARSSEVQTIVVSAHNLTYALNAVEGKVSFDAEMFEFKKAETSTGVISFWITYPHECERGVICFSGITPGGFFDASNELFGFTLLPKKTGTSTITLDPIRLLQHDGKGTDEPVAPTSMQLYLEFSEYESSGSTKFDNEPPEAFTPIIVADEDISGGAYSVVFTTEDKQTGIKGYFIKEAKIPWLAWLTPWREATSPYQLKDQERTSYVFVKAVDVSGNERVMTLAPVKPLPDWFLPGVLCASILLLICFIALYQHRRKNT